MIIKLPSAMIRGRIKLVCGLVMFVWLASQINADFFIPVIVAWLIHELGHWLSARFGAVDMRLQSGWLGVGLNYSGDLMPKQEIGIALAGPAADLLWFGFCFCLGWQIFALSALVLAVVNLLPVLPLDGGRALAAVMGRYVPILRVVSILVYSGQVLALVLAMVIINFEMRLWLMFLPAAIFLLAATEEKKAVYNCIAPDKKALNHAQKQLSFQELSGLIQILLK